MLLKESQVRGLVELIRTIHTHPPWQSPQPFFESLHRIVPSDYSFAFMRLDDVDHKVLPSPITLSNGGGDDARLVREYNDYFWRFKAPIVRAILEHRASALHVPTTASRHLTRQQSREFLSDFWLKHRIRYCYARYFRTPRGVQAVYVSRYAPAGDFSSEERTLLDLLCPHLEVVAARHEADLPCLFADKSGKILCQDEATEAALVNDRAATALLQRSLARWVGELGREPLQSVTRTATADGRDYRFTLSAAGTGRFPLIRVSWHAESNTAAPDAALRTLAARWRLSPRERDVLGGLVDGKQMKEIAQQLGLAVDTVKEYLGSVYRKAGADGRGPLVAKVLAEVMKPRLV